MHGRAADPSAHRSTVAGSAAAVSCLDKRLRRRAGPWWCTLGLPLVSSAASSLGAPPSAAAATAVSCLATIATIATVFACSWGGCWPAGMASAAGLGGGRAAAASAAADSGAVALAAPPAGWPGWPCRHTPLAACRGGLLAPRTSVPAAGTAAPSLLVPVRPPAASRLGIALHAGPLHSRARSAVAQLAAAWLASSLTLGDSGRPLACSASFHWGWLSQHLPGDAILAAASCRSCSAMPHWAWHAGSVPGWPQHTGAGRLTSRALARPAGPMPGRAQLAGACRLAHSAVLASLLAFEVFEMLAHYLLGSSHNLLGSAHYMVTRRREARSHLLGGSQRVLGSASCRVAWRREARGLALNALCAPLLTAWPRRNAAWPAGACPDACLGTQLASLCSALPAISSSSNQGRRLLQCLISA